MKGFEKELKDNILHFWATKMIDEEHGGFYGAINGHNQLVPQAAKGSVMNARILWTFSAAYRVLGQEEYRLVAVRALTYLTDYFLDKKHGGIFWELDYAGNVKNPKKQTYAQGFALYAFAEYYRATEDPEVLRQAIRLFHHLESCRDREYGGYWEAFTVDWQPIADMRLSEKDQNEAKTMNTHLHVLEAYTNMLRIWRDEELVMAQQSLIRIFLDKIYNPQSGHLQLFFDREWQVKGDAISYGHDIEAAWLLWEAVSVLGDELLIAEVRMVMAKIVVAATEGLLPDGSMAYERKNNHLDDERHWWVQAEAIVGYMYAARTTHNPTLKTKAAALWHYIQTALVDGEEGEWYWSRMGDGRINRAEDKAGFWKCPYHNGRMCLEMIENFNLRT